MYGGVQGPVAIYIRVSTEDQADRGTPRMQRHDLDRFAAYHDLAITDYYMDEGVSGMLQMEDRPEGARLLRDARAGRFRYVLVWRIDRLARKAFYSHKVINDLEMCGVAVYSVQDSINSATEAGALTLAIMAAQAQSERSALIARTSAGMARKHREGAWVGGPVPFGYRVGEDGALVISESLMPGSRYSEADVVRLVYRLSVHDRRNNTQIAARLQSENVPTPAYRDGETKRKKGAAPRYGWQPSTVRRILINPLYKGEYVFGRSGVRKGKRQEVAVSEQPAIVSHADWDAAQAQMDESAKLAFRNAKRSYLLTGLLRCGECGTAYVGASSGPRHYYRCNAAVSLNGELGAQGKRCPSVSARAEELEAAVWEGIEEFRRNPGSVVERLARKMTTEMAEADDTHAALLAAQGDLAAKDGERDSILALYRRGRIAEAAMDKQLDAIAAEEETIKETIAALQARARAADASKLALSGAEAMLRELATVEVTDDATKRAIIQRLVRRVTIHTVGEKGHREPDVVIEYYFGSPEERRVADRIPGRTPASRAG